MKRLLLFFILVVSFSAFLVGCGKESGSEYIGKWVNSKMASETLEIKRNGDNFIVTQTMPDFFGGTKTSDYPAVFKDDVLTINAGLGPITMSYVKDDDTLVVGGNKFNHQK